MSGLGTETAFFFPSGLPHLSISTHAKYLGIHPQRPNCREGTEKKGLGEWSFVDFFWPKQAQQSQGGN